MTKHPQWTYHDDGHWWDDWNDLRDDDPAHASWEVDVKEAIMFDGYCACGNPETLVDAMAAYLNSGRTTDVAHFPLVETDLDLAMAYWADRRGFTDHGGSVYAQWITDAGNRWLALTQEKP